MLVNVSNISISIQEYLSKSIFEYFFIRILDIISKISKILIKIIFCSYYMHIFYL